jgi:hypothetical protein
MRYPRRYWIELNSEADMDNKPYLLKSEDGTPFTSQGNGAYYRVSSASKEVAQTWAQKHNCSLPE